jgi:CDP-6-deoxy-D-xylo-4-hexulose-3-dehydrase
MMRPDAPFSRNELTAFLDSHRIGTRLLFAGNLTRQPAYSGLDYRIASSLDNTDAIMRNVFWIGLYPGLTKPMLDYVVDSIHSFCKR